MTHMEEILTTPTIHLLLEVGVAVCFIEVTTSFNFFYFDDILSSGYDDDIFLLVRLGHAALIVFMIFAIICILYMLFSCCMTVVNRKQKS